MTPRHPNWHHSPSRVVEGRRLSGSPPGGKQWRLTRRALARQERRWCNHAYTPVSFRRSATSKWRDFRSPAERLQPTRRKHYLSIWENWRPVHPLVLHISSSGSILSRRLMETNVMHHPDSLEKRVWQPSTHPPPSLFPSSIWWRENRRTWRRNKKRRCYGFKARVFEEDRKDEILSYISLFIDGWEATLPSIQTINS